MHKYRHSSPENQGFLLLSTFISLAVIFWLFLEDLMYWSCATLYHLWSACDFSWSHSFVAPKINVLAKVANNAEHLSIMQWISVLNQTAGILMIGLIPVLIIGMATTLRHPENQTRREISIHSLPEIMARFSPSVIPSLCYGDRQTQLLNTDPPEHQSALTPEEFARKNGLVVNQRLDHEKATAIFTQQLGRKITQLPELNDYERALFAIFGLAFFFNNRQEAEALLDTLNRSCLIKSRRDKGQRGIPVFSAARHAFKKVAAHPLAKNGIKQHPYARTALAALHANDLHLPPARFRWLKGLDRPLWYALCSSDRPKSFIEGAGIVTQMQWEREAAKQNVSLASPVLTSAVEGLERDLLHFGEVLNDPVKK